MESTTLNFLADDGAVTVTFTPALDVDHYTELYGIATGDYVLLQGSCDRIRTKANEWGLACQIDGR
jgi:hypothetical protein